VTEVKEVVPFLAVVDMPASLAFYMDGLGFAMEGKWVDDGVLRWCRLRLGGASLMLQQFRTSGHDARRFGDDKGEGVVLCFFCADAVAFHRAVRERGLDATEPQVGNAMWVTEMIDPDGYRLLFESPTDVPEETRLSQIR
jgi:catechol 2,3-dioxygenase-like lactoylglutathione lyase family enzyme